MAGLIAVVWLPAIRQWSYDWSTNPQYFYGWAVPMLAAYLAYERVVKLPAAKPIHSRWLFVTLVLVAVVQLPLRWFGEANSDWWPVWWGYGSICIAVTFGLILVVGGWPWVRAFVFPVLFMASAIPWPTYFEIAVVQGLMGINAAISAEVVSALGAPAIAVGNVIEVSSGVLGVNEACSGIRSLQSTLMAALFLAGLYQLRWGQGILLVMIGAGIAFVCNIVRTSFLTFEGATKGIEATEKWHDTAGFVILGVVLVCLFFISQFLDKRSRQSASKASFEQKPSVLQYGFPKKLVWATVIAMATWFVVCEGATEVWYRVHEMRARENPHWSFQWPDQSGSATKEFAEFPVAGQEVLHFDRARGATWLDSFSNRWVVTVLEWNPGKKVSAMDSRHNPIICLPSVGFELVKELGWASVDSPAGKLNFRGFEFKRGGAKPYVFSAVIRPLDLPEGTLRSGRLERRLTQLEKAINGNRQSPERVLLVAVEGPRSLSEAEVALREEVQKWVKLK